jgi:hypothetical protein
MTPDFDQAVTKQQGANPNSPEVSMVIEFRALTAMRTAR